ncbi:MAG: 2-oxoacid:acceptor oxidoreductase family protein [Candidatus Omnitrophota bacterium]|nr:MAG: 2-oxoacid:acceptor oxidoreductase family protein [Candidatus Omnitrophota bacterium]
MQTTRIICAGFGGQGIMTLGKVLATLGMKNGKSVSWMPSYGAEVRGGTAHSMVIISDSDIPSPVIDKADICIVMNKPSLDKFESRVKKGGTIILNSSLIESSVKRKDINAVKVPATEIASSLGNIKVANIVALGALVSKTKIVSKNKAISLLKEFFAEKKALLELNKKAFNEGIRI